MQKNILNKSLINQAIKKLDGKTVELNDGNRLRLILSGVNKGAGHWSLLVKDENGKAKRINLGQFNIKSLDKEDDGYITLQKARELAQNITIDIKQKLQLKKQESCANAIDGDDNRITFAKVYDNYLELKSSKFRASTSENYAKLVKTIKQLGIYHYPLEEYTNDFLRAKLLPLYHQKKHAKIKNLLTLINSIKRHASDTGLTPLLNRNKSTLIFDLKETEMRPFLEPSKLPLFFQALHSSAICSKDKLIIIALILTMSRYNELIDFKEDELEQDPIYGLIWSIPPNRMKGKRRHILLLENNPLLLKVMLKVKEYHKEFKTSDQARLNKLIKELAKHKITLHGFRSTSATLLNALYPNRMNDISLCLAHKLKHASDVDERYNRYSYIQEKGEIYQLWSKYLQDNTCINSIVEQL